MKYTNRIKNLDAMRAAAVILVILAHLNFSVVPGGSGVTIFFTLSGFVICRLILREYSVTGNFSARSFAARRILKIGPPFFALVIMPSLALYFFQSASQVKLGVLLQQTAFTYNWYKMFNGPNGAMPGSQVVWSLSIEEQFYLIFAALWYFLRKRTRPQTKLFWATLVIWITSSADRIYLASKHLNHDSTGNTPRIYYGTDTRISAIAIGVLLALIFDSNSVHYNLKKFQKILQSRSLFFFAVLIFIVSLLFRSPYFRDSWRFSFQEVASALFIAGAIADKSWPLFLQKIASFNYISLIGLSSYCIYLAHLTIIEYSAKWINLNQVQGKIVLFLISIICGILFYYLLDRPFEKLRSKFRPNRIE
jgi:peptidoglycan/LPS O-acetylase OafA/YrhL